VTNPVYTGHGIRIRKIVFSHTREPSYEIMKRGSADMMTRSEFRKMVLTLVKHLMEAEG